jgi:hypothetical protein
VMIVMILEDQGWFCGFGVVRKGGWYGVEHGEGLKGRYIGDDIVFGGHRKWIMVLFRYSAAVLGLGG